MMNDTASPPLRASSDHLRATLGRDRIIAASALDEARRLRVLADTLRMKLAVTAVLIGGRR
ncbi:hypothetical protein [Prescottella equi]|uniref:hypothetical protein n=1 Tax=Rhodococcus hoagii TaxID=43767 RepID=UPI000A0FC1EF|nr:hypothetical protein [Prescottella equi]ORL76412.1 hypothetical protein A5N71_16365 [Prescottella equi]